MIVLRASWPKPTSGGMTTKNTCLKIKDLLSFNMSLFLSGQHSGNTAHFIYQTSFDDLVTLSILKSRILVAFNACSVIEKENDSK